MGSQSEKFYEKGSKMGEKGGFPGDQSSEYFRLLPLALWTG